MRIKFLRVFSLNVVEIYTLFAAAYFLIRADFRMRMSSSRGVLKNLQNFSLRPHAWAFFLAPLEKLKKSRVVSLLEAVDKNFPWKPSCVRRTLALSKLSHRLGWQPELKIGVYREDKNLKAHTWLELDGNKLEMQDDGIPYTALTTTVNR